MIQCVHDTRNGERDGCYNTMHNDRDIERVLQQSNTQGVHEKNDTLRDHNVFTTKNDTLRDCRCEKNERTIE